MRQQFYFLIGILIAILLCLLTDCRAAEQSKACKDAQQLVDKCIAERHRTCSREVKAAFKACNWKLDE